MACEKRGRIASRLPALWGSDTLPESGSLRDLYLRADEVVELLTKKHRETEISSQTVPPTEQLSLCLTTPSMSTTRVTLPSQQVTLSGGDSTSRSFTRSPSTFSLLGPAEQKGFIAGHLACLHSLDRCQAKTTPSAIGNWNAYVEAARFFCKGIANYDLDWSIFSISLEEHFSGIQGEQSDLRGRKVTEYMSRFRSILFFHVHEQCATATWAVHLGRRPREQCYMHSMWHTVQP